MRIEQLWKWRVRRRFGKGNYVTHWMTEAEAKARHPEAVVMTGTLLEISVPETEKEWAQRPIGMIGPTGIK